MTLLEQARIAHKCLPDSGGPVLVNHSGKASPEAYQPALTYFQEANCPHAFIKAILTENGEWCDPCQYDLDIYEQSPRQLNKSLRNCFNNVYSLANGSLDHLFDNGFNRHDPEHIDAVTTTTLRLLKRAGYTEDVQSRGVAAARGHDLGNPLSRKAHSLISPIIFQKTIRSVDKDPAQWRIIRRAIQLHNEPIAGALIYSWGELSEQEIIDKMRASFGPEALALIIADKTDIGRHRISEKPKDSKAVDQDPHLEVNLLGKTESLELSRNKKVFTWNLLFTPGMSEEEQKSDPRFTQERQHDQQIRARISKSTHELHQQYRIPHLDRWKSLFWSLYFDRMRLAIRSTFALFPNVETFILRITDTDMAEETVYTFTKENLCQNLETLQLKYSIEKTTR